MPIIGLAVSREVSKLRELVSSPKVRLTSIWTALSGCGILALLSTHVLDAALNSMADQAIKLLANIFKFSR